MVMQVELDGYHRRMCRRLASTLIGAMAETDCSFDIIAARLGREEDALRYYMTRLIDGNGKDFPLDFISDFAFAMGCEIEFYINRNPEPLPTETSTVEVETKESTQ